MSVKVSITLEGGQTFEFSHGSEPGNLDALGESIRRAQEESNKFLTEKIQESGAGQGTADDAGDDDEEEEDDDEDDEDAKEPERKKAKV